MHCAALDFSLAATNIAAMAKADGRRLPAPLPFGVNSLELSPETVTSEAVGLSYATTEYHCVSEGGSLSLQ